MTCTHCADTGKCDGGYRDCCQHVEAPNPPRPRVNVLRVSSYGTERLYIEDPETARRVRELTGNATVTYHQLDVLVALGMQAYAIRDSAKRP